MNGEQNDKKRRLSKVRKSWSAITAHVLMETVHKRRIRCEWMTEHNQIRMIKSQMLCRATSERKMRRATIAYILRDTVH